MAILVCQGWVNLRYMVRRECAFLAHCCDDEVHAVPLVKFMSSYVRS